MAIFKAPDGSPAMPMTYVDAQRKDDVNSPRPLPTMTMDDIYHVNRRAQQQAMLVGVGAGATAGFASSNLFRLNFKTSIASGIVSGCITSFIASYAFTNRGIRTLEVGEKLLRNGQRPANDTMTQLDLRAGQNVQHEAGVGGLHELEDRTHSTRGDH